MRGTSHLFCASCGNKVEPQSSIPSQFCGACGTKLLRPPEQVPVSTATTPLVPHVPERQRPPEAATSTWRQVIQCTRDSVVLIENPGGLGSGLLVSKDGLIVTNRHVIAGNRAANVAFHDGVQSRALVVHQHDHRDLAVIRAAVRREKAFDLQKVSHDAHAGDEVVAIGHPRGLRFTSTRGIISEPHRHLPDGEYIQTDVAINPGNSGGPLLDWRGCLVGLNTQIQRDSQGLCFAIPAHEVTQYVMSVVTMLRTRKVPFPSDVDINSTKMDMDAVEIFGAAARGFNFTMEASGEREQMRFFKLRTPLGSIHLAIGSVCVYLNYDLCTDLHLAERENVDLLLTIMEWHDEMPIGPRFCLERDDPQALRLTSGRLAEGLDVCEAEQLIDAMCETIERFGVPLLRHLGRMG